MDGLFELFRAWQFILKSDSHPVIYGSIGLYKKLLVLGDGPNRKEIFECLRGWVYHRRQHFH